jgi:hypothetical protein
MDSLSLKKGFIGYIVLIIIAVILLKFWLDIDVIDWLNRPEVKDFFTKIWLFISHIWDNYIWASIKKILDFINHLISRYI